MRARSSGGCLPWVWLVALAWEGFGSGNSFMGIIGAGRTADAAGLESSFWHMLGDVWREV
jgi:hypothetical protein